MILCIRAASLLILGASTAGLPDQWTIIGGVVVIGGIVVLVVFDHRRTEQEKRTLEQRLPTSNTLPSAPITELVASSFADDMREFATHDFHA